MRTILAPMEGVVDHGMRDVLTRVGGYHRCVTEFVRVNDQRIPEHVFFRFAPELKQGSVTPAGVPVFLQLLGSNYQSMADNASALQVLEPQGIDLNFGCPSKTVNKSDGGSALLREPQRVGDVVAAVRDAVDAKIPVTAKIRLGFSNHDQLHEIASRVEAAGANELCIHARTREDRYKPPAYWSVVKQLSGQIGIPIIINGEIWSVDDAQLARTQSGCEDIMLGRGALSCPDLALSVSAEQQAIDYLQMRWSEVLELLLSYLQQSVAKHPLFVSNRCKQWLVFLQREYPAAKNLFHTVKRLKQAEDVFAAIETHQHQIS